MQVNFNDFNKSTAKTEGTRVGFFSLKNDGDEAVVRIMHDSTADFDILTTHTVQVPGSKFGRKVSCVKGPYDSADKCPLCAMGEQVQRRMFIHMIQYVKEGEYIAAKPVVWERSMQYANNLRDMINEYGPLSDQIFKIKRSGAAGSQDTKYAIMYANPQMYPASVYPKDADLFKDYHALGTVVLDKTPEEIQEFLITGNFPMKQKTAPQQQFNPETAKPAYTAEPTFEQAVQQSPFGVEPVRTAPAVAPWDEPQAAGMERPQRYF